MDSNLQQYYKLRKEYKKLNEDEKYLMTLIGLAEQQLRLDELSKLSPYIRDIIKKTVKLREEKKEIDDKLSQYQPEYTRLLQEFNNALANVTTFSKSLADFTSAEEFKDEKFSKELENIKNIRSRLEEIAVELTQLKESDEFRKYSDVIEDDINKIVDAIKTINSLDKILYPDIENLKESWGLIGAKVYLENEEIGYINGIFYQMPDIELVFQVVKEETVTEKELKILHEILYKNLTISEDYPTFKKIMINDVAEYFNGSESDIYRPSIIRLYLRLKNWDVSAGFIKKLKAKPKKVGYFRKLDITKINMDEKKVEVDKIIKPMDIGKLIPAPSIRKLDPDVIGKSILISYNYNYTIYHQTWLPGIGMAAILLRKDRMNTPVPDIEFIKKILMYIETKKSSKNENVKEETSGDLYWKLKVMVMKTLSNLPEITETKALQPKYLFEFILRKKIPIIYTELYQTYFAAIPTELIKERGGTLTTIIPVKPTYLRKIFTKEVIPLIFGERCQELLGTIVKKGKGVTIECCDKINKELKARIRKNFDVDEEIFNVAKDDTKRLIRTLIISGHIKGKEDYNLLMKMVNKTDLSYSNILKPLEKDLKLLLQFYFLKNIKLLGKEK
ncbi:MAG: hypothetical protein ACP6IP_05685 [Candidatus Njordarchaeia archaeon]